jgi:SAM-dependent methyltransferase
MKLLALIKYFFFTGINWNWPIAFFLFRDNLYGEKKYGIRTTGTDHLQKLEKNGIDISHATMYMPVSYWMLEQVFKQFTGGNHFIDLGCGKGRALCVAAHSGFAKITGIDFSKELCQAAEENILATSQKIPGLSYQIINNDAFYFDIPKDADCLFLFNPFDEVILSGVIENILLSLEDFPRDISVIYINPMHLELFMENGFKQVHHFQRMKYLEGVILKMDQ